MILAQNVGELFGKVTPAPGLYTATVAGGLGKLLTVSIQLFLVVSAFTLLFFLLWGGFDWIMSGGDREKVEGAQQKITNALLGIFIVVGALTVFVYITGNLFGIIKFDKGFHFNLPTLQDVPAPGRSAPRPTYKAD